MKKKLMGLAVAALYASCAWAASMQTFVVNVGQGDGVLLLTPGGKKIVIDGGPSTSATSAFQAFLDKKAVSTVNVMVLTHPHADHMAGLTTTLSRKVVQAVYDPKQSYSSTGYTNFKNAVAAEKCAYIKSNTGDSYAWDSALTIKCLNARSNVTDANNASVALRIVHGSNTLHFSGDSPTSDAQNLEEASYASYLPARFYKVAHHGSRYSSSSTFLTKMDGGAGLRYSFISVGAGNTYGHPHSEATSRLGAVGSLIYRTDQSGSLRVTTDGIGGYFIGTNQ